MIRYYDTRHRTRDLLLEYDSTIVPLHPRAGGLTAVYPWETQNVTIMGDWLYAFAVKSGYNGSKEDFYKGFGAYLESNQHEIIFDVYKNFPPIGTQNMLYFDTDEKILYYWDGEYIPVNAMLITETILNGGEA